MPSEQVGDRWEYFLEELVSANDRGILEEGEENFVEQMIERLSRYEERAYVSTPQINWINRIIDRNSQPRVRSRR